MKSSSRIAALVLRFARRLAIFPLILAGLMGVIAHPAAAQTTTPPWYMYDSYASNSFPPTAPYESASPNAIVIEGLYPCEGSNYTTSAVAYWTYLWIQAGYQVVTEITPYAYCQSLGAYESEMATIEKDIEANATNPGRYWAGFMLDEEAGYGFGVSSLQSLNSYVSNMMAGTTGMSWYFEEDQPNGWILSQYNSVLGNSWPAPQAYTSSMISAINGECTTYGNCTNLVTVNSQFAYPYDDYAWVTSQVGEYAWSNSYWGNSTWVNYWRPQ